MEKSREIVTAMKWGPGQDALSAKARASLFVGKSRKALLEKFLLELKESAKSRSIQHYLVIGTRGMGKSFFLSILYDKVKEGHAGDVWVPIKTMENEDQITSAQAFMASIMRYLGNTPLSGAVELANDIHRIKDENTAVQQATEQLEELCKKNKKRILLLVNNFDEIYENMFKDTSKAALRGILQQHFWLKLIGTTRNITFLKLLQEEYEVELFGQLSTEELEQLSGDEVITLLYKIAEVEGDKEVLEKIGSAEWRERRVNAKALAELCCGAPRMIYVMYPFIVESRTESGLTVLHKTLDDLTTYYEAQRMYLSSQERAVYSVIAKLNGSASPSEIAEELHMDMNVLSTYLARLQDKDYIEKVHADSADARIVRYQIPDKIYVVWYQKNYGAKDARYKWLVEFYKTAYSAEELEHGVGEPEAPEIVRESKLRALSELKAQVSQTMIVETVPEDKELSEWNAALDKGIEAYQKGKFNDALSEWTRAQKACEILVKKYPDNLMYQEKLAGSLNNLGLLMNDMGRFLESLNYKERALALFEALLTRDPTNARFQSSVAMALNNLGNLLSDLGRREESLKRYESALEMRETLLNSDPKNINYQSSVIGTTTNQVDLLTTIGRHRDAIRTLDAAIRIIPENHELLLLRSSANLALQNDGLARDDLRAALNLLESKGNGEFLTEIHPALLSYLRHGTPGFTIEAIKIVCAVFGTSLEDEKAKPLIPFKMAAEFLASDRSSGTLFNLDPLTRDATYKVLRDSGHEGDIEALNYKGKRKKRK